jgi:peroxiredoxin Q/BCP
MRILWFSLLSALCFASLALAQDPKSPTRPAPGTATGGSGTPHPQTRLSGEVYIGDRAPDFDLWSSRNRELRLSRLRGDFVLLTFADRREQLAPLAEIYESLASVGCVLLAVCSEKPQALQSYSQRQRIPFEMLSDVTGEISAMYGLYDGGRREIRPGFMVLDRQGVVRVALLGSMPPPGQIADLTRYIVTGLTGTPGEETAKRTPSSP